MVAAHALAAPFTKVEESFNLQAVHDLLYHGPLAVNKFDHLEFPGVVPRTFFGALAVAGASAPLALLLDAAGLPRLAGLLVVRLTLVRRNFVKFQQHSACLTGKWNSFRNSR